MSARRRGVGALFDDGLYHLISSAEWEAARTSGVIRPASLGTEGFVHCSWGRQVPGTVAKHFGDATDLLALRLEPTRLAPITLVEEDSYSSGDEFPHLYGPLPTGAVVDIVTLI